MDVLTKDEINTIISGSAIRRKYEAHINRESAYEILSGKIEEAQSEETQKKLKEQQEELPTERKSSEKSTFEQVLSSPVAKQIGRTVASTLVRGLMGVLGVPATTRRRTTKTPRWW
jgi:hypothetical protein